MCAKRPSPGHPIVPPALLHNIQEHLPAGPTDGPHEGCFLSSRLLPQCTLIELFIWLEEIVRATARHGGVSAAPAGAREMARDWRASNPQHSFRISGKHLALIAHYYTDFDDGIIRDWLNELLDAAECPFCCWPRILVHMNRRIITRAGFTVDEHCRIATWDTYWSGFEALRHRDNTPARGTAVGCPVAGHYPTPDELAPIFADYLFMYGFVWALGDRWLQALADASVRHGLRKAPVDSSLRNPVVVQCFCEALAELGVLQQLVGIYQARLTRPPLAESEIDAVRHMLVDGVGFHKPNAH